MGGAHDAALPERGDAEERRPVGACALRVEQARLGGAVLRDYRWVWSGV